MLKIITVNLPTAYLMAMDKLTGEKGLYPSRSELIRVAVREFLIKEMENCMNLEEIKAILSETISSPSLLQRTNKAIVEKNSLLPSISPSAMPNNSPPADALFVQIPVDSPSNGDLIPSYKTFKIIRK
jgi:Arc/MetJ-type ribon-helix-helix transcriptional regulator